MKPLSRREFVARGAGATALTGTCLCGLSGCSTFTKIGDTPAIEHGAYEVKSPDCLTIRLDQSPTLAQVGGSVKILDARLPEPLIVAHVENDRFVAASLRCPHRGVELEYQPKQKRFCCASLGHSRFALDGRKLGGPAPRPIKAYSVSAANDTLTIKWQA